MPTTACQPELAKSKTGREDVPRIVADLVAAGERVYGARLLASTLEEVYLEAVGGRTG